MKNKMKLVQNKLEMRKATKKGAASIETIIVSGLLLALAVFIVTKFTGTINTSATQSNTAITTAVTNANADTAKNNVKP